MTMAEAMQQVRRDMGADAVIIATHKSRRGRGVEITAAIDDERTPPPLTPLDPREPALGTPPIPALPDPADGSLLQAFAYHGVPPALRQRLTRLAREVESDVSVERLAKVFQTHFRFMPLPVQPEVPIFLLGPPGAGKSITAAKLATRAVVAGHKVSVITCDTVKAGGVDQLGAFITLLDQTLITAETPEELAQAVSRASAEGPVIVDSPGTNPYDPIERQDLERFLNACLMDPVLVMPAGTDSAEAAEAASVFTKLGASRFVATRLDASRRYGSLLSLPDEVGLPLADASMSPFVTRGFHSFNPLALARLIVRDPARNPIEAEFREDT
jgi:flagellar biosynthesis protein FlhF